MTIPRRSPPPARRVIVVVADGLRPDIIPLLDLPVFGRLVRQGASTLHGRTIRPSVTAAAMGSLLTGVEPHTHGLVSSRFRIPKPAAPIDPLPRVLRATGLATAAWMAELPWAYRGLGATIGRKLGFDTVSFRGDGAATIMAAARDHLASQREGLFVMHWPDTDRAGHVHGWPSPAYLQAARWMDRCLGELDHVTNASRDPHTLLIVIADHGGGGTSRCDHESDHPLNRTIPIILAGGAVRRVTLPPGSSLLDIAPTILHALGVRIPSSYAGRPLREAFRDESGRPVLQRRREFEREALLPLAEAG